MFYFHIWNAQLNELYIFCDSGRIVRPVFVLKDDLTNELIQGDFQRMVSWSQIIHGHMYDVNPTISPTDDTYYRDELIKLKQEKDFIVTLEETQAPIEYIDSTEVNIVVAKDYRTMISNIRIVLNWSILSAVTVNIPFQNCSSKEMYFYHNKLNKRSVCIPVLTIQGLTHLYIMHYPQNN